MAKYMLAGRGRNITKESALEINALFKKIGAIPGTTHLWSAVNGNSVFAIIETENDHEVLKYTTAFGPYMDLDIVPVVDLDDTALAAVEEGHATWTS